MEDARFNEGAFMTGPAFRPPRAAWMFRYVYPRFRLYLEGSTAIQPPEIGPYAPDVLSNSGASATCRASYIWILLLRSYRKFLETALSIARLAALRPACDAPASPKQFGRVVRLSGQFGLSRPEVSRGTTNLRSALVFGSPASALTCRLKCLSHLVDAIRNYQVDGPSVVGLHGGPSCSHK